MSYVFYHDKYSNTVLLKLAFSVNGYMLDDKYSNLYQNIIETIMCMKNWVAVKFKLQNCMIDDIFEEFKNLNIKDE